MFYVNHRSISVIYKKKKKYVIKYVKKNYGFENQIFLTAKKIHVEKINLFESVKWRKIPNCQNNSKTVLKNGRNRVNIDILTHIYMTAHFPGLVQALQ